jgi:hypothetical protein
MELEGIAAARDLLYDPIPLNGLMRVLGSRSSQQRPQGEMRRRKAGQIVLAERQRFSQLQRTGQRSKRSQVKWVKVPPGD